MTDESTKPAPQVVGVQGFVALESVPTEDPAARWLSLAAYPPFQMFIEEREPNVQQINSAQYALERGRAAFAEHGEDFMNGYLAWWEGKGYWRGENPMGRR